MDIFVNSKVIENIKNDKFEEESIDYYKKQISNEIKKTNNKRNIDLVFECIQKISVIRNETNDWN